MRESRQWNESNTMARATKRNRAELLLDEPGDRLQTFLLASWQSLDSPFQGLVRISLFFAEKFDFSITPAALFILRSGYCWTMPKQWKLSQRALPLLFSDKGFVA